ncbi:MAG: DMT family transporter [Rhodobacteraceae bacterium]|nr:MAG: DMT family transporter [Paracoccaceae bacterium]
MPNDNIRAALYMMAGSSAFAVNDTFIKLLGREMGMFQIFVLRGIVVSAIFGLIVWHARVVFADLTRADRNFLLIRSASEAFAAFFFFNALFNMPLANVTAILQVVPLAVALAAFLVLNEPLGWRRLTAILIGFGGVMLIVQPGTDSFAMASIHALACVVMVTLRDLSTRMMAVKVPSSLVALTTSLGVMLFGVFGSIFETWVMPSPRAWVWLSGTVLFACLGYYLIILAMRVGEISFAAPFRYASLVAAILLGWFALNEWPDNLTFIGSAIVVATGVFALYRERQLQARIRAAQTG